MTDLDRMTGRWTFGSVVLLFVLACVVRGEDSSQQGPDVSSSPATKEAAIHKELFRGRVLLLQKALEEFDLRVAEEMEAQVVLRTEHGELIPILADWRGRAFYQDERLRDRDVELVGFRRKGLPYLQVLMVFTFDDEGERQYTDYWCDVCSIPMYEIKACECCQGEIRLRFQPKELPEYLKADEAPNPPTDG